MNIEFIKGLSELYLQAIGRNIDITLPEEQICDAIISQTPSIEWQKKSLLTMSNRQVVSEEELEMLSNYQSYGYTNINTALRDYGAKPKLNSVIERMPEIDRDIVVFRYLSHHKFLPKTVGEIFVSKGYLSTTMDVLRAASATCENITDWGKGAIMKIRVPKGKKAIYLCCWEKELLFAHNIQMRLEKYMIGKMVCASKDKSTCHIVGDVPQYEFVML